MGWRFHWVGQQRGLLSGWFERKEFQLEELSRSASKENNENKSQLETAVRGNQRKVTLMPQCQSNRASSPLAFQLHLVPSEMTP